MTISEAIESRHSVRSYTDKKIEGETLSELQHCIAECNEAGGLSIQLCLNEPGAFSGTMAAYGKFGNVKNYIALVGKKSKDFEERCGYYGEKIVLKAQQLGLNTCWVAMTFSKSKSKKFINIRPGEKLLMVISVGYGINNGVPHKIKSVEQLSEAKGSLPEWFYKGVEAAGLAPTAVNQQKFKFSLDNTSVHASAGSGFYTKVDLGIAKYHFEIGAGDSGWQWAKE